MSKCIKEYQNSDCYQQELKFEKGKLHVIYLLIIAVLLVIIAISIHFGSDSDFMGQISMASTISSIILSAIAIFMSISGENKNSYVQNQMTETSSKLSGTAQQLNDINETVLTTLENRLKEISEIKDELKSIRDNVDSVQGLIGDVFSGRGKNDLVENEISIDKLYKEVQVTFNPEAQDVFANVVRYMLTNNYTLKDINNKEEEIYREKIKGKYIEKYGYMILGAAAVVIGRANENNRKILEEVL